MLTWNPLTNLDQLTWRKCSTCKGEGFLFDGHKLNYTCPLCSGTGWAIAPIAADVCGKCNGTRVFGGGVTPFRRRECPVCSGTGERWPDVLVTEDVFDDVGIWDAIGTAHDVPSRTDYNDIRASIFAAIAAYCERTKGQGRVFLRVKSVASAQAWYEWASRPRTLEPTTITLSEQYKIHERVQQDQYKLATRNIIPTAVLGQECGRCKGKGQCYQWRDCDQAASDLIPCPDCNRTGTIPTTQAEADALIAAVLVIPATQHAVQVVGVEEGVSFPRSWWCDEYFPDNHIDILLVPQQVLAVESRFGTSHEPPGSRVGAPTADKVTGGAADSEAAGRTTFPALSSPVTAFSQLLADARAAGVEVLSYE